jgi:hypothetical protein
MSKRDKKIWLSAVEALSVMCVYELTGKGPTKEAFILTLRMYADNMEKLLTKEPNNE